MPAGKYRHRITIERDTGTAVDAYNNVVESWSDYFAGVPAEIDTGGSRKFYAAQQVQSELTHMVTIRYISGLDLTAKMRITWGTRTFDLLGPPIDSLGKRQEYEFRCVEAVR